jgi:TRAP-type mannitol/chloroaromatic compound transport system permease small subunit
MKNNIVGYALLSIERWLGLISGVIILVMMTITCVDIVSRKVWEAIPGVYEAVEVLMVFLVYLGLSFTESKKVNVRMDAIITRFPIRWQHLFEAVGLLLAFGITAVLTWATTERAYAAWDIGETTAGLVTFQVWPAKLMIAVGFLALDVRFAYQYVQTVREFLREK